MKKLVRIILILAVWATVTWIFREKLLPIPRPDPNPPPHFRDEAATPAPPSIAPAESDASDETEDLTEVRGIGPVYQHRLAEMGVTTLAELATGDPAAIADHVEVSETQVREWMDQARDLTG